MHCTAFALLASLSFAAPSLSAPTDNPATAPALPFVFAADVPPEQVHSLTKDLNVLMAWKFHGDDPELQELLELPTLSSAALLQWLSERVHYLLSETFNLQAAVRRLDESFPYENPTTLPPSISFLPRSSAFASSQTAEILMWNAGGALYMVGKKMTHLLGVNIPGVGLVTIRSPRVGLIQLGNAFFKPILKRHDHSFSSQFRQDDTSSTTYSISRLGSLFHEARHSDGNGTSLSFLHFLCPLGHDFEGTAACDSNLNGPYTVQSKLTRQLTLSCATCSTKEKERLKLVLLDSQARVLKEAPQYNSEALKLLQCQKMQRQGKSLSSEVAQKCARFYATIKMTPAVKWDSRPEGQH